MYICICKYIPLLSPPSSLGTTILSIQNGNPKANMKGAYSRIENPGCPQQTHNSKINEKQSRHIMKHPLKERSETIKSGTWGRVLGTNSKNQQ